MFQMCVVHRELKCQRTDQSCKEMKWRQGSEMKKVFYVKGVSTERRQWRGVAIRCRTGHGGAQKPDHAAGSNLRQLYPGLRGGMFLIITWKSTDSIAAFMHSEIFRKVSKRMASRIFWSGPFVTFVKWEMS